MRAAAVLAADVGARSCCRRRHVLWAACGRAGEPARATGLLPCWLQKQACSGRGRLRVGQSVFDLRVLRLRLSASLSRGNQAMQAVKDQIRDRNMPLSCGNVELRRFELRTSCMPYKSGQSPDMAGCGPASSFSRSTSPVIARYCRLLAPRLAPGGCSSPLRQRPAARFGGPTHRRSSRSAAACGQGAELPRCQAAREPRR
jgi:hypothetical protein